MTNNSIVFKHNKKRNIGLISEFFSRYIAAAILEKRHSDIDKAKALWDKYFVKGTELYKELRLFNALYETTLKNKETACSLIDRVRKECSTQSQEKLDKEKLSLIGEVNRILKDEQFFDRNIAEYKTYASVQLLMNAWRGTGFKGSLSDLAQLEEVILEHVLTEKLDKKSQAQKLLTMNEREVDGLVLKIVYEKLNNKFTELFSKDQRQIIDTYVFGENNEETNKKLSVLFESIRSNTIELIDNQYIKFEAALRTKLLDVKKSLQEEYKDTSQINDETVGFYLNVLKLKEELISPDDKGNEK